MDELRVSGRCGGVEVWRWWRCGGVEVWRWWRWRWGDEGVEGGGAVQGLAAGLEGWRGGADASPN